MHTAEDCVRQETTEVMPRRVAPADSNWQSPSQGWGPAGSAGHATVTILFINDGRLDGLTVLL